MKWTMLLAAVWAGAAGQEHSWTFPFDPFRMECRKGHGMAALTLALTGSTGGNRKDIRYKSRCGDMQSLFPVPEDVLSRLEREDCRWSRSFDPLNANIDSTDSCIGREYVAGLARIALRRVSVLCCVLRTREPTECQRKIFPPITKLKPNVNLNVPNSVLTAISVKGGEVRAKFCKFRQRNLGKTETETPSSALLRTTTTTRPTTTATTTTPTPTTITTTITEIPITARRGSAWRPRATVRPSRRPRPSPAAARSRSQRPLPRTSSHKISATEISTEDLSPPSIPQRPQKPRRLRPQGVVPPSAPRVPPRPPPQSRSTLELQHPARNPATTQQRDEGLPTIVALPQGLREGNPFSPGAPGPRPVLNVQYPGPQAQSLPWLPGPPPPPPGVLPAPLAQPVLHHHLQLSNPTPWLPHAPPPSSPGVLPPGPPAPAAAPAFAAPGFDPPGFAPDGPPDTPPPSTTTTTVPTTPEPTTTSTAPSTTTTTTTEPTTTTTTPRPTTRPTTTTTTTTTATTTPKTTTTTTTASTTPTPTEPTTEGWRWTTKKTELEEDPEPTGLETTTLDYYSRISMETVWNGTEWVYIAADGTEIPAFEDPIEVERRLREKALEMERLGLKTPPDAEKIPGSDDKFVDPVFSLKESKDGDPHYYDDEFSGDDLLSYEEFLAHEERLGRIPDYGSQEALDAIADLDGIPVHRPITDHRPIPEHHPIKEDVMPRNPDSAEPAPVPTSAWGPPPTLKPAPPPPPPPPSSPTTNPSTPPPPPADPELPQPVAPVTRAQAAPLVASEQDLEHAPTQPAPLHHWAFPPLGDEDYGLDHPGDLDGGLEDGLSDSDYEPALPDEDYHPDHDLDSGHEDSLPVPEDDYEPALLDEDYQPPALVGNEEVDEPIPHAEPTQPPVEEPVNTHARTTAPPALPTKNPYYLQMLEAREKWERERLKLIEADQDRLDKQRQRPVYADPPATPIPTPRPTPRATPRPSPRSVTRPRPQRRRQLAVSLDGHCTTESAALDEAGLVIACGIGVDIWQPPVHCPRDTGCFQSPDTPYRICCRFPSAP